MQVSRQAREMGSFYQELQYIVSPLLLCFYLVTPVFHLQCTKCDSHHISGLLFMYIRKYFLNYSVLKMWFVAFGFALYNFTNYLELIIFVFQSSWMSEFDWTTFGVSDF